MSENPVFAQIKQEVDDNDVVLFMKGTPVFPQCGFSARTVQILQSLDVEFSAVDVLSDPEIRAVLSYIKSTWPERERGYQESVSDAN